MNLAESKSPGAITPIPRPLTRTVPTLTLSDHPRSRPAPSILGQNHMHIAAESIYAVFEVKPTISRQKGTGCSCHCARKEWTRDAAEKAASVRALRLHQHSRRVVDLFYSAIIAAFRRNGNRSRCGFDGIWPTAAIVSRMAPTHRAKTGELAASSDGAVIPSAARDLVLRKNPEGSRTAFRDEPRRSSRAAYPPAE